jgi:hypothetical protein
MRGLASAILLVWTMAARAAESATPLSALLNEAVQNNPTFSR